MVWLWSVAAYAGFTFALYTWSALMDKRAESSLQLARLILMAWSGFLLIGAIERLFPEVLQ